RLMTNAAAYPPRQDFVSAIVTIEAVGKPGAAEDLRKFARTLLEWCVSSGRAHSNVLAGLRQPKRSRAERLAAAANGGTALSDDQIRKLWQTASDFGSYGGLVRLALLTGARRGELPALERNHLRADPTILLPEHPNTRAQHPAP